MKSKYRIQQLESANRILLKGLREVARMDKTLPEDLPWDDVMESIRLTADSFIKAARKEAKG
jgi:hypothetical protein